MHTFCNVGKFCVRSKAHVFLSRKAVTIKFLGPWVTLAGEHRSTAVPHCHTQTTAWLNKTKRRNDKMLHNECKMTAIMMKTKTQCYTHLYFV